MVGDRLGHWLVEGQDHEGDGALVGAAQVHGADVDVGLAHGPADQADGTGPVLVSRDQHVGGGGEVDLVAVEGYKTRLPDDTVPATERSPRSVSSEE